MNKDAAGDDHGRRCRPALLPALAGLFGSDRVRLAVCADGTASHDGLSADNATGIVGKPRFPRFTASTDHETTRASEPGRRSASTPPTARIRGFERRQQPVRRTPRRHLPRRRAPVRRPKELETENERLRKAASDLTHEKLILGEAASGNPRAPPVAAVVSIMSCRSSACRNGSPAVSSANTDRPGARCRAGAPTRRRSRRTSSRSHPGEAAAAVGGSRLCCAMPDGSRT